LCTAKKTILTQSYLIPWIMVLKLLHRILSPVAKIEVGNIFANYQVVGFKSFMGSTSSLFFNGIYNILKELLHKIKTISENWMLSFE